MYYFRPQKRYSNVWNDAISKSGLLSMYEYTLPVFTLDILFLHLIPIAYTDEQTMH